MRDVTKSRAIMGASAVVLAVCGLGCTFLPQEFLAVVGVAPNAVMTAVVQILGALLLAFAMVNWMAKDSLIGGIYNRPVAVGNLVHFAVGAITLAKLVLAGGAPRYLLLPAVLYAVFAIAFATLVFGSPVKPAD
ncbi:MAG: hypothetical protein QOH21_251 [Acidobacteriota bacterium]|jgi:hypothetical protein|nr:hypothetical protein [Acidobacteriota bacterium]